MGNGGQIYLSDRPSAFCRFLPVASLPPTGQVGAPGLAELKLCSGFYSRGRLGKLCTDGPLQGLIKSPCRSLISDLNDVFWCNFSGNNAVDICVDLWCSDRDNERVTCGCVVALKGPSSFPPAE